MKPNTIFKSFKPNKPILSLLSIEVLIGILGEIMPEGLKKKIEVLIQINLGGYIEEIWMAVFGVTVLVFLWLSLRREKSDSVEKIEPTNLLENERDKIIKRLEKRYAERLKQKLDERIAVNLGLKYTTVGTNEEFADTYFVQDAKDEKAIKSKLVEVLEQHSHLLIVGEPGAGKTTLLLELAIELLKQAKENESLSFPVILNLASWRGENDFGEWIRAVLVIRDSFRKEVAQDFLEKRQILPLLDGLDEISDSKLRSDCLEKLKQFLPNYNPEKLVVCSRIDEYKEAEIDAPVRAEILVKPLSLNQVTKLLRDIKDSKIETPLSTSPTSAGNMLRWIEKSDAAGKVFCNPFYFNLASQAFEIQHIQENIPQEETVLQHYLVQQFVDRKLSKSSKQFSSANKNQNWLIWLSQKLSEERMVAFSLANFQPKMLKNSYLRTLVTISSVTGLFLFLLGNLLLLPFPVFLIIGVIQSFTDGIIQIYKLLSWAFIIGLVTLLFVGFEIVLDLLFDSDEMIEENYGTAFNSNPYQAFSLPYQVFSPSFFRVFSPFLATLAGISFVRYYLFSFNNKTSIFEIVMIVLVSILLSIFFTPLVQHFLLRIYLFFEGSMPFRYVDFLNYATRLRILERDGGQWRFRHKILQDYFANLESGNVSK